MQARDPFTLVIFGASGDLSKRKLIPALYHLDNAGYLPDRYAVVGFSRTPLSDAQYRDAMLADLKTQKLNEPEKLTAQHKLLQALHYHPGNNDEADSFKRLEARIRELERERKLPGNRLYYLSVAPEFFATIVRRLHEAGMIRGKNDATWSRVIIEKPFGTDLQSARALNIAVTAVLDENQIYRIDHYLGKETVQNILGFRFGNSIFEPLFNQKYVDNVQITVAETLGMEGRRGAYYDGAGAIRDMVQNHMLQLLCLTAMEPPSTLDGTSIRDEKVKVLRALEPMSVDEVAAYTVRGQYTPGQDPATRQAIKGYPEEEGVKPGSVTESYVAMRLQIENWRWAGVPFLLRTGKRLKKRVSEIAVTFKRPPLHLFGKNQQSDYCLISDRPKSNTLVLRIQPDEGISLSFACKQPGLQIQLNEVHMDFFYGQAFQQRSPEAYERLLLDALRGDASLFTRSDEVDSAWKFITSILNGWKELPKPKFPNYAPFGDGPEEAHRLLSGTQAQWRSIGAM
ncbi:MAG: glucose-6-phosphate dehydrogenase [Planctomycetes bacterium]|nr:glucose-6-phosphate dehydrogenase [Planctomycetota bacterium]